MKWITREKVKVDSVVCPWLISKFIDPQAELIFVPSDQVDAKACELGATPFDIEGCQLVGPARGLKGSRRKKGGMDPQRTALQRFKVDGKSRGLIERGGVF